MVNRHVVGYILLAAGTVFGLGYSYSNEQALKREVLQRCQISEDSRAVLFAEHTVKLRRTRAYLREHPNGAPGIPRRLILDSIHDERVILRKVQPQPCR